ncbi:hypothetical protein [Halopseudomonas salegens]|uniref:Uncharacterized protein n=1 Tax=Halopseudomonas salegens TaxID=1434072 RepID=A0A1H2FGG0_9GAMM|nr:hypothetical protein [Halopseudomonas salegens]SDU06353.1 hypothetical protein SAMN05216210_1535 [Halopseudomonas salegens]
MTLTQELLAYAIAILFIAMILFVMVGQTTVRRLRKNPEVKDSLGMELASGWDILNVAGALSRPKWFSEMMRKSPLGFMAADERPLYEHTNKFERCLARMFFWSWAISGTSLLTIAILSKLGALD